MCSCSLFFFSLLLIFTLVSASISHFLTAPIKFSCFSSNETRLLVFYLDLSLLSTSVQTLKFSRKINSALLLFFLSKSRVVMRFTTKTRWCLKREIAPRLTRRGGRTYGSTYGRFCQNQNFLDAWITKIFYHLVLRCARQLCYYYFQYFSN